MRTILPLALAAATVVAALVLEPMPGEAGRQRQDPALRGKQGALVELGRRLFFEPILSRTGRRSCASCHDPDYGFSDPSPFSEDDIGRTLRHSQTILDSAFNPNAHWDGEFRTIEALVTARVGLPQSARGTGYGRSANPLAGHSTVPFDPEDEDQDAPAADERVITSRDEDLDLKLSKLPRGQDVLESHGRYAEAMKDAFGDPKVTRSRAARAIAAYCRSVTHTVSAYDRWHAGDLNALSASALRGHKLFVGRAGCVKCHVVTPYDRKARARAGHRAAFTDLAFHNTGIAFRETIGKHDGEDTPNNLVRGFVFDDPGRSRLSSVRTDRRAFKTPTLRDVTRRGPYMHNASLKTLEEVVRHYANGGRAYGTADPELDERLQPFTVSDQDVADLVAFLGALEGETRPGLASAPYRARAKQTRLRFVDARGDPVAGLKIRLVPAGDRLPVEQGTAAAQIATTDAKGWISYPVLPTTHVRLVVPDAIVPEGGSLVPDTCAKATVRLPVRGHATVALLVSDGVVVPKTFPAEHVNAIRFEGHEPARTMLTQTHVLQADGYRIVRYRGWMRTDVPPEVTLRLPGAPAADPKAPLRLSAKHTLRVDMRDTRAVSR